MVAPQDKVHIARQTYARGNCDNRKFGCQWRWQLPYKEHATKGLRNTGALVANKRILLECDVFFHNRAMHNQRKVESVTSLQKASASRTSTCMQLQLNFSIERGMSHHSVEELNESLSLEQLNCSLFNLNCQNLLLHAHKV